MARRLKMKRGKKKLSFLKRLERETEEDVKYLNKALDV